MGVSFFGAAAPENFATFDAAFMTLFYVTGGDPWPDTLPKHNEDGTTNWQVSITLPPSLPPSLSPFVRLSKRQPVRPTFPSSPSVLLLHSYLGPIRLPSIRLPSTYPNSFASYYLFSSVHFFVLTSQGAATVLTPTAPSSSCLNDASTRVSLQSHPQRPKHRLRPVVSAAKPAPARGPAEPRVGSPPHMLGACPHGCHSGKRPAPT